MDWSRRPPWPQLLSALIVGVQTAVASGAFATLLILTDWFGWPEQIAPMNAAMRGWNLDGRVFLVCVAVVVGLAATGTGGLTFSDLWTGQRWATTGAIIGGWVWTGVILLGFGPTTYSMAAKETMTVLLVPAVVVTLLQVVATVGTPRPSAGPPQRR